MTTPAENAERMDRLETRIAKLEDLLREISGMAKLLRWLFALLLFLGLGPMAVDKVKQLLVVASR